MKQLVRVLATGAHVLACILDTEAITLDKAEVSIRLLAPLYSQRMPIAMRLRQLADRISINETEHVSTNKSSK